MHITEKVQNRFKTVLVSKKETDKVGLYLFSNEIFFVFIKRHTVIDMDLVIEITEFLGKENDNPHYNIVEFEPFSESVNEARNWAAGQTNERTSLADAFVVNNLAHKILMDSYLKQSKPIFPTGIFSTTDEACDWIAEIINGKA